MSKNQNSETVCAIERTLHRLSVEEIYHLLDQTYGMPDLAEELSELIGKISDRIDATQIQKKAEIYRHCA